MPPFVSLMESERAVTQQFSGEARHNSSVLWRADALPFVSFVETEEEFSKAHPAAGQADREARCTYFLVSNPGPKNSRSRSRSHANTVFN